MHYGSYLRADKYLYSYRSAFDMFDLHAFFFYSTSYNSSIRTLPFLRIFGNLRPLINSYSYLLFYFVRIITSYTVYLFPLSHIVPPLESCSPRVSRLKSGPGRIKLSSQGKARFQADKHSASMYAQSYELGPHVFG